MNSKTKDRKPLSNAEIERALARGGRHGCAGCGGLMDDHALSIVATAPGRVTSAYHQSCVPAGAKLHAAALLPPSPGDQFDQQDRDYFDAHPSRVAYVRAPFGVVELAQGFIHRVQSLERAGASRERIRAEEAGACETAQAYVDDPASVAIVVVRVEEEVLVRATMLLPPGHAVTDVPQDVVDDAAFGIARGYHAARSTGVSPTHAFSVMRLPDAAETQRAVH